MLSLLLVAFATLQNDTVHVVVGGKERIGRLEPYKGGAALTLNADGRAEVIALADVASLRFEAAPKDTSTQGERVLLGSAGLLTGRLTVKDERAALDSPYGRFTLDRGHVHSVQFADFEQDPFFHIARDDSTPDLLITAREEQPGAVPQAIRGTLLTLGEETVSLREAMGDVVDVPRRLARALHLGLAPDKDADLAGSLARVRLRNGDRLVGTLGAIDGDVVKLVSPVVGEATFKLEAVHTIRFGATPLPTDTFLVCDFDHVLALDRGGVAVWRYPRRIATSARRLPNGNVLITAPSEVVEVTPQGKTGGTVVHTIEHRGNPVDARRLPDGNTLVVDTLDNRVLEYDGDGQVAWKTTRYARPTGARRLADGTTIIVAATAIVQVDRDQNEIRRLPRAGGSVELLPNGHMRVLSERIVEYGPDGREIWRSSFYSRGRIATRLSDGHWLVLFNSGLIAELDVGGRVIATFLGDRRAHFVGAD